MFVCSSARGKAFNVRSDIEVSEPAYAPFGTSGTGATAFVEQKRDYSYSEEFLRGLETNPGMMERTSEGASSPFATSACAWVDIQILAEGVNGHDNAEKPSGRPLLRSWPVPYRRNFAFPSRRRAPKVKTVPDDDIQAVAEALVRSVREFGWALDTEGPTVVRCGGVIPLGRNLVSRWTRQNHPVLALAFFALRSGADEPSRMNCDES
jgi:hypothetical protein